MRGRARRSRLSPQAAAPSTPLDLVAIGNSWFEYPLYDNGPWPEETGIVAPVQLQSMGNPPPQILNLAQHGDATTAMLSWENQQTLQSELEDGTWLNPQTNLPDAILVSGYDYAEGVAIVKTMIDMVHDMFAGLAVFP